VLKETLDTPWRASNELRRLLALPFIRLMFNLKGVSWGRAWRILGMPLIQRHRGSTINLGDGLTLRSWATSNPLTPNHAVVLATRTPTAVITIGNDCGLTGATLVAAERIEIGDRVLIGSNTTIVDTDFHPLDQQERREHVNNGKHRAVKIESDVFIGMNSLILKGVRIGQGSVIGAGSVVTKDVPPNVIVAGNPAQIVHHFEPLETEEIQHTSCGSVIGNKT
jgi:acetyltransferase-like isoleucine patch superfamily enzyme